MRSRDAEDTVKLTVDIRESVYRRYDDMYLDFRSIHRDLRRKDFAELVIDYGLSYSRLKGAIKERAREE